MKAPKLRRFFNYALARKRLGVRVIIALVVGLAALAYGSHLSGGSDETSKFIGEILKEFGRLLGIYAVFTLLTDHLQRQQLVTEVAAAVTAETREIVFAHLPAINATGLVAIHPEMDFKALFQGLEQDDELLWLDTFAPALDYWHPDLEAAAKRGATIKFLVLSHESLLAPLRQDETGVTYIDSYASKLQEFSQSLCRIRNKLSASGSPDRVFVYNYDGLLGCPIYIVRRKDEPSIAFSSLYLNCATGRGFHHFEWRGGCENGMLESLEEYIEYKLDRATEVA